MPTARGRVISGTKLSRKLNFSDYIDEKREGRSEEVKQLVEDDEIYEDDETEELEPPDEEEDEYDDDEEGPSWDEYAPEILSAVSNGELDNWLQVIAKACRTRYFELNPGKVNGLPVQSGTYLGAMLTAEQLGTVVVRSETNRIDAIRAGDLPSTRNEVAINGSVYSKRAIIGAYFRVPRGWTAPRRGQGYMAQITGIGRSRMTFKLVEVPAGMDVRWEATQKLMARSYGVPFGQMAFILRGKV